MGYEYLNGSLVIFNSGFCLPGRGPGPSQIGLRGAGIGNPRARGKLGTKWSPERQTEVGDHIGHPQGVQVRVSNP